MYLLLPNDEDTQRNFCDFAVVVVAQFGKISPKPIAIGLASSIRCVSHAKYRATLSCQHQFVESSIFRFSPRG